MSTSIDLGEEAVTAEIEAIAVDLDRLRQPADLSVGLEHDDRAAQPAEQVARGQTSGAAAENERRPVFVAVDCHRVPAQTSSWMLTTPHVDDGLERFEEVPLQQDLVRLNDRDLAEMRIVGDVLRSRFARSR